MNLALPNLRLGFDMVIYLGGNPVDFYLIVIPPEPMEDTQSHHDNEAHVCIHTNTNDN